MYLIYGEEEFLIENEVTNIISKSGVDELNISKYDLLFDSLKDIIDDACTVSLFSDKKIVVINNFDNISKIDDKIVDEFDKFIHNISSDVILILACTKLDERKKLTKELKKLCTVKEFNKNKNISNTVRSMFQDYRIDYSTVDLLIKIVGNDLMILNQEAIKLMTYKTDKVITKEDVLSLCSSNSNDDIFDLINAVVSKDKDRALSIYSNLIRSNEEPIKIIITLANQFRLIYQCKKLYKKGNSEDSISKIIDVHPYRVKLALEKGKNYSSKVILNYLDNLSDIDNNIKSGVIDKNLAFELFLLGN